MLLSSRIQSIQPVRPLSSCLTSFQKMTIQVIIAATFSIYKKRWAKFTKDVSVKREKAVQKLLQKATSGKRRCFTSLAERKLPMRYVRLKMSKMKVASRSSSASPVTQTRPI